MERKEIYRQALLKLGIDSQVEKAGEELIELALALKRYNDKKSPSNRNRVIEEIADVLNMAEQLAYIFGEASVEEEREFKLVQLAKRLDEIPEEKEDVEENPI